MKPHEIVIRKMNVNIVGSCTACSWWSMSMGTDESSRASVHASFDAWHPDEVTA